MPIPPGPDKIEPLGKDQPAPFSGQIFSTATAIRWGNYLEQCRERLQYSDELHKKFTAIEVRALNDKMELQQKTYESFAAQQQARIAELEKPPPFYRTTWFGFVVGVVASAALVTSAALIAK